MMTLSYVLRRCKAARVRPGFVKRCLFYWSPEQMQPRFPGVSRPRIRRSYVARMSLDQKVQLRS